jgi:hypothetical protein
MSSIRRTGLRVGVDLDNTLVCYDPVFQRLARERGVARAERASTKEALRQDLRQRGMDTVWTAMQGEAYGVCMKSARPFPGACGFLYACADGGAEVFIVSHRTRFPVAGPLCDLHEAARHWLSENAVFEILGGAESVFLETTRQAKLRRVAALTLDFFVDDLLEVLLDPDFPAHTAGVHFDPHGAAPAGSPFLSVRSWDEVQQLVLPSP